MASSSCSLGPRRLMPPYVLQPCRLIVRTLLWKIPLGLLGAPTSPTTPETSSRESGNFGLEISGNIAEKWRLVRQMWEFLRAANLRHGTDGFTSPPKEGTLRIFRPENSNGLEPANLGIRGRRANP
jgi:hypothetical protein